MKKLMMAVAVAALAVAGARAQSQAPSQPPARPQAPVLPQAPAAPALPKLAAPGGAERAALHQHQALLFAHLEAMRKACVTGATGCDAARSQVASDFEQLRKDRQAVDAIRPGGSAP